MKINALTVCVDYSDFLHRSISRWCQGLESLLVVTSPADKATQDLCEMLDIPTHVTDAFYRDGASFNKGRAMEEARLTMPWEDWILFFDADILPELKWYRGVQGADHARLNGAKRLYGDRVTPTPIPDDRLGYGYFQLFHSLNPVVDRTPLLDGSWRHAGGYDSAFLDLWPRPAKEMPIKLHHMGEGSNWFGRGNQGEYNKLVSERVKFGGILPSERL